MDNILNTISDLFLGNGLIIVIGCFVVGMLVKGSVESLPNKFIPYINIVVAIILGFCIPGTFDEEPIVSKIIMLSFLGMASVGFYEVLCILVKDRFSLDIKQIYNNIVNPDESEASNQTTVVNRMDDIDIELNDSDSES